MTSSMQTPAASATTRLTRVGAPGLLGAALLAFGCSAAVASGPAGKTATGASSSSTSAAAPLAAIEEPGARNANLAGARCKNGAPCVCRQRIGGDKAESPPPDEAHKRFEIRLAGVGGGAVFDSPTLGHLTAGSDEACFYIDVLPGTTSDVVFTAVEGKKEGGVGPVLDIAEYGPKGPWWYDVLNVHCEGPEGRCNRDAADGWSKVAKGRKRGRVDPCGSSVISHLQWLTSGGSGDRELGVFQDFQVKFTMEVKRFPTQWPPHAKECVSQ
jgi:hypothetical protein